MSENKILDLSLKCREVPVKLDGKACTLRELTGEGRDTYLNKMSSNVKYVDGKASGMRSFKGVQSDLLAKCLHNADGELFPEKEIEAFPASVQNALFEMAQEINGMDNEADETAKKD